MRNQIPLTIVIIFSLIIIIVQIYQIKQIIIRQKFSKIEKIFVYIFSILLLTFSGLTFNTFQEQMMFVLLVINLNLVPYVHGFTEKGARIIHQGNVSRQYLFKNTSEWILYRQKHKLKCRFIYKKPSDSFGDVQYLYFMKTDEKAIISLLERKNFYVIVENEQ
ncbi:hypothetical protein [Marinilactibacillus kalidii]|uniref:hypothetical protein n=1 Tax=Marinilactibacillus kalidii TaxID=2820274 RepID=UPI001ABEC635|nr:hypothetical protein [Marinilactibacillus kalidii]